MEKIQWRNNIIFEENITIDEAIEHAVNGKDSGLWGYFLLVPKTDDCPQWLSFLGYLALVYEKTNQA